MPLDFLEFSYPVKKNLVDQMSKTDLVRVSLQSHRADMALKECGKDDISFFKLDAAEILGLSAFDKAEMFMLEAARQGTLSEFPIELSVVTSKTCKIYFKNNQKKFRLPMEIQSLKDIDRYFGVRKNLIIRDNFVPIIITEDDELISFWNSKTDGLIAVLQYFGEEFGITINSLELNDDGSLEYSDNLRHVVRCCLQMSVNNVSVEVESDDDDLDGDDDDDDDLDGDDDDDDGDDKKQKLTDDNYKFVLENLPVTGFFGAYSKTSEHFKFDGTIRANVIYITNGQWFTLQHLLGWTDYEELIVEGKNFTAEELKIFLKKWVAGGFPKLKLLKLESEQMFYEATEGFERRHDIRLPIIPKVEFTWIKGCNGNYATVRSNSNRTGFNMSVKYQELR